MTAPIIVEDGFNTSYIDSILMALFYKHTHLYEMLIDIPEQSKFVYLQDIIGNNFIDQIRRNFSIDASVINEIRNYSFICGWKEGLNITELYNTVDYLDFLMKGFSYGGIKYELIEIPKNSQEEIIKSININYIEFKISNDSDTKTLMEKWINMILQKKSFDAISYYHFSELPMLIPIYLNRLDENDQINKFKIDIKKKIRFSDNNDKTQAEALWTIHAIICYTSSGKGHYYSIINTINNQWYLFSNGKISSLSKIDISDDDFSNKIKQECMLILYRLDENLCKL